VPDERARGPELGPELIEALTGQYKGEREKAFREGDHRAWGEFIT